MIADLAMEMSLFIKTLSMIVDACSVILVGKLITGKKEYKDKLLINSAVGTWVAVFNKSILKSPAIWTDIRFPLFIIFRISSSSKLKALRSVFGGLYTLPINTFCILFCGNSINRHSRLG